MKMTDPTLQPIAEQVHDRVLSYSEQDGSPNYVRELLSASELERMITAVVDAALPLVRAAVAAPVLALHQPIGGTAACGECCALYPCPTVHVLGGDVW